MELRVDDHITANPGADDVIHAIDAAADAEDWYINLDMANGCYVEAFPDEDGKFTLVCEVDLKRYTAASPVDAAELKRFFLKCLKRDPGWRDGYDWLVEDPGDDASATVAARKTSSEPPAWAIAAVVGTFFGVVLLANLIQGSETVSALMPFASSDSFGIGLIALPVIVLIILIVAVKLVQARRAAHWPPTSGHILKSGMEVRRHQFAGEATTVTSVPVVEYEFAAMGRNWRGSRISIGEDTGGANTEATLARYPVGALVTVYYDPADPGNCVLERDIPKGMGKGCAAIIGIGAAVVGGIWWLTTHATQLIGTVLPNANAGLTVFAACFGLLALLFFFVSRRQTRQATNWPFVRGRIESSTVETLRTTVDGRSRTTFAPAVEYAYEVNGVRYRSRQINLALKISGTQGYAEGVVARYPEGSEIDVHYDPANPSSAALENPTGPAWLILAVALFCFGLALHQSGIFR